MYVLDHHIAFRVVNDWCKVQEVEHDRKTQRLIQCDDSKPQSYQASRFLQPIIIFCILNSRESSRFYPRTSSMYIVHVCVLDRRQLFRTKCYVTHYQNP